MNDLLDEADHASDGDEELHFLSTQMQARHEEFEDQESNINKRKQILTRMNLFKNEEEQSSIRHNLPVVKKTISKKKPKKKSNKVTSLSSFVRENMGNKNTITEIRKGDSNRSTQLSILEYFSGDKKKVNEILKRIEKEESLNDSKLNVDLRKHIDSTPKPSDAQILYTREEWADIVKRIKLKFPQLSPRVDKSLKTISKRIQRISDIEKIENENNTNLPMWSQASFLPEEKLDDEDLKRLYDLNDEQMVNDNSVIVQDSLHDRPFVMTLSQALAELSDLKSDENEENKDNEVLYDIVGSSPDKDDFEEIANSSPEPEILELTENEIKEWNKNHNRLENDFLVDTQDFISTQNDHRISSHQPESILGSKYKDEFQFSPSLASISQSSVKKPVVINSIYGTQNLPIELSSDKNTSLRKEDNLLSFTPMKSKDTHQVIDSSPIRSNEVTPFKTPTKKTKQLLDLSNLSSPSKLKPSLIHKPVLQQQMSILESLGKEANVKEAPDEEEVVSPSEDEESIYLTSRSEIIQSREPTSNIKFDYPSTFESTGVVGNSADSPKHINSIVEPLQPANQSAKKKTYKTSRLEVRGSVDFIDMSNDESNYKIRKVGTKVINLDSENEIGDSEDEFFNKEESVIFEVSVPIEGPGVINQGEIDKVDTSIIQVPSSPSQHLISMSSSSFCDRDVNLNSQYDDRSAILPTQVNKRLIESQDKRYQENDIAGNVFDRMNTKQLKEKLQDWGLKPVRSRIQMVKVLSNAVKLINTQITSDDLKVSQDSTALLAIPKSEFKVTVYNNLTKAIKSSKFWYSKIISFEPILLEELQAWLESDCFGVAVERELLERYCDELGISCTSAK